MANLYSVKITYQVTGYLTVAANKASDIKEILRDGLDVNELDFEADPIIEVHEVVDEGEY